MAYFLKENAVAGFDNDLVKAMIDTVNSGEKPIPGVDFCSHKEIYQLVQIVKPSTIEMFFKDWMDHPGWVNLNDKFYMWLVMDATPEGCRLVDFDKLFTSRLDINWFKEVVPSVNDILDDVPEYLSDPSKYIEMLYYFKTFQVEHKDWSQDQSKYICFDIEMKKQAISDLFLINPYSEALEGYFDYEPSSRKVFSSEGISVIEKPQPREEILRPQEDFDKMFDEFTCGLLTNPLGNEILENPFEDPDIVIAGGSICKLLDARIELFDCKSSDVDIFVLGEDPLLKIERIKKLLLWFSRDNYDVYYGVNGCVVGIYILDTKRVFQIIASGRTSIQDLLNKFDMTHVKWCWQGGNVIGTPESFMALRSKTSVLSNRVETSPKRIIKAMYYGYDIVDNSLFGKIDINNLINDKQLVKKIIRKLINVYYPVGDQGVGADATEFHTFMIETTTNNREVYTCVNKTINNVNVLEDFETSYKGKIIEVGEAAREDLCFKNFGLHNKFLCHGDANIVFGSTDIEITDICSSRYCVIISAKIDARLQNFFRRNNAVYDNIVNGDMIKFSIREYKIEKMRDIGKSILISKNGNMLCLDEDLIIGDIVKILFMVRYSNSDYKYSINAYKIIKQSVDPIIIKED